LDHGSNRLKRWAYKELATSVHLHHALVAEEYKRLGAALGRVAKVLSKLFLWTQILWLIFSVTEAIATKGGSITTFEKYRSPLAQLYLSLSLAVLSLLALYTFVVVAVQELMNAISLPSKTPSSEDTFVNVAIILRYIETDCLSSS
jgi:hypothetical protein